MSDKKICPKGKAVCDCDEEELIILDDDDIEMTDINNKKSFINDLMNEVKIIEKFDFQNDGIRPPPNRDSKPHGKAFEQLIFKYIFGVNYNESDKIFNRSPQDLPSKKEMELDKEESEKNGGFIITLNKKGKEIKIKNGFYNGVFNTIYPNTNLSIKAGKDDIKDIPGGNMERYTKSLENDEYIIVLIDWSANIDKREAVITKIDFYNTSRIKDDIKNLKKKMDKKQVISFKELDILLIENKRLHDLVNNLGFDTSGLKLPAMKKQRSLLPTGTLQEQKIIEELDNLIENKSKIDKVNKSWKKELGESPATSSIRSAKSSQRAEMTISLKNIKPFKTIKVENEKINILGKIIPFVNYSIPLDRLKKIFDVKTEEEVDKILENVKDEEFKRILNIQELIEIENIEKFIKELNKLPPGKSRDMILDINKKIITDNVADKSNEILNLLVINGVQKRGNIKIIDNILKGLKAEELNAILLYIKSGGDLPFDYFEKKTIKDLKDEIKRLAIETKEEKDVEIILEDPEFTSDGTFTDLIIIDNYDEAELSPREKKLIFIPTQQDIIDNSLMERHNKDQTVKNKIKTFLSPIGDDFYNNFNTLYNEVDESFEEQEKLDDEADKLIEEIKRILNGTEGGGLKESPIL